MKRKWISLFMLAAGLMAVAALQSGCEDGGDEPASVDVNGFYEGTAPNGTTAAATFVQDGSSVTAPEAKINRFGSIEGTLSGAHFTFTMTYSEGDTETGEGDFSADGMNFTGSLSSAGDFDLSWRGPDFEHHTPLGQPLEYTKP